MSSQTKTLRRRVLVARRMTAKERQLRPSRRRPALWLRGFLSDRAEIYPDLRSRYSNYVSDWQAHMHHRLNPHELTDLLEDKRGLAAHLTCAGFGGHLPVTVGQIRERVLHCDSGLEAPEGFIIKPRLGRQGRGVRFVADRGGLAAVAREYEDALVQRRLVNHPYAAAVNPGSLNTIRVIAMRDPVTSEPFVGAAVHRFGSVRTGCIDSFSQGGVSSPIDLQNGILGALIGRDRLGLTTHRVHPESGVQVAGLEIPHWEDCKSLVIELMRVLPGAVHVGWDIAVTPSGPTAVEANGYPYFPLLQVHGPISLPRAVEFYRHHGLLR